MRIVKKLLLNSFGVGLVLSLPCSAVAQADLSEHVQVENLFRSYEVYEVNEDGEKTGTTGTETVGSYVPKEEIESFDVEGLTIALGMPGRDLDDLENIDDGREEILEEAFKNAGLEGGLALLTGDPKGVALAGAQGLVSYLSYKEKPEPPESLDNVGGVQVLTLVGPNYIPGLGAKNGVRRDAADDLIAYQEEYDRFFESFRFDYDPLASHLVSLGYDEKLPMVFEPMGFRLGSSVAIDNDSRIVAGSAGTRFNFWAPPDMMGLESLFDGVNAPLIPIGIYGAYETSVLLELVGQNQFDDRISMVEAVQAERMAAMQDPNNIDNEFAEILEGASSVNQGLTALEAGRNAGRLGFKGFSRIAAMREVARARRSIQVIDWVTGSSTWIGGVTTSPSTQTKTSLRSKLKTSVHRFKRTGILEKAGNVVSVIDNALFFLEAANIVIDAIDLALDGELKEIHRIKGSPIRTGLFDTLLPINALEWHSSDPVLHWRRAEKADWTGNPHARTPAERAKWLVEMDDRVPPEFIDPGKPGSRRATGYSMGVERGRLASVSRSTRSGYSYLDAYQYQTGVGWSPLLSMSLDSMEGIDDLRREVSKWQMMRKTANEIKAGKKQLTPDFRGKAAKTEVLGDDVFVVREGGGGILWFPHRLNPDRHQTLKFHNLASNMYFSSAPSREYRLEFSPPNLGPTSDWDAFRRTGRFPICLVYGPISDLAVAKQETWTAPTLVFGADGKLYALHKTTWKADKYDQLENKILLGKTQSLSQKGAGDRLDKQGKLIYPPPNEGNDDTEAEWILPPRLGPDPNDFQLREETDEDASAWFAYEPIAVPDSVGSVAGLGRSIAFDGRLLASADDQNRVHLWFWNDDAQRFDYIKHFEPAHEHDDTVTMRGEFLEFTDDTLVGVDRFKNADEEEKQVVWATRITGINGEIEVTVTGDEELFPARGAPVFLGRDITESVGRSALSLEDDEESNPVVKARLSLPDEAVNARLEIELRLAAVDDLSDEDVQNRESLLATLEGNADSEGNVDTQWEPKSIDFGDETLSVAVVTGNGTVPLGKAERLSGSSENGGILYVRESTWKLIPPPDLSLTGAELVLSYHTEKGDSEANREILALATDDIVDQAPVSDKESHASITTSEVAAQKRVYSPNETVTFLVPEDEYRVFTSGAYGYKVFTPDEASGERNAHVESQVGQVSEAELALRKFVGTLSGRVVDNVGEPMPDVPVRLILDEEELDTTTTDPIGHFMLTNVALDRTGQTLELNLPEGMRLLAEQTEVEADDFVVKEVASDWSVEGTVCFDYDEPVPNEKVRMVRNGDHGSYSSETLTDGDGSFEFLGLFPGKYQLFIREGTPHEQVKYFVVEDATTPAQKFEVPTYQVGLNVDLPRGTTDTVDETAFKIESIGSLGSSGEPSDEFEGTGSVITVDQLKGGSWLFRFDRSKWYLVEESVRGGGYRSFYSGPNGIEVNGLSEDIELDVLLVPMRKVTGQLARPDGSPFPVEDIRLVLSGAIKGTEEYRKDVFSEDEGQRHFFTRADADGNFEFSIPEGDYRLRIEGGFYFADTVPTRENLLELVGDDVDLGELSIETEAVELSGEVDPVRRGMEVFLEWNRQSEPLNLDSEFQFETGLLDPRYDYRIRTILPPGVVPGDMDLDLIELGDRTEIGYRRDFPVTGTDIIYVAKDEEGELYFRAFDQAGRIMVNSRESDFANDPAISERIEGLKPRLDDVWPTIQTEDQKRAIVDAVRAITGLARQREDGRYEMTRRFTLDAPRHLSVEKGATGLTESWQDWYFPGGTKGDVWRDGSKVIPVVDDFFVPHRKAIQQWEGRESFNDEATDFVNLVGFDYTQPGYLWTGEKIVIETIRQDFLMVSEDQPAESPIGSLAEIPGFLGEDAAYTLKSTDVPPFEIVDGFRLITTDSLDFENVTEYELIIGVNDDTSSSDWTVPVRVRDVNEPPVADVDVDESVRSEGRIDIDVTSIHDGDQGDQQVTVRRVDFGQSPVVSDYEVLKHPSDASGFKIPLYLDPRYAGEVQVEITLRDDGGTVHGGSDHNTYLRKFSIEKAPLAILKQPESQRIEAGSALRLEVVMGSGGLENAYQWYRNGEAIPEATDPVFSVEEATVDFTGRYHVEITNSAGRVVSNSADVEVTQAGEPGDLIVWAPRSKVFPHAQVSYQVMTDVVDAVSLPIGVGLALKGSGSVATFRIFDEATAPRYWDSIGNLKRLKVRREVELLEEIPESLRDVEVEQIAAGGKHFVALKADGGVIAWGENNHGQTDVPEIQLTIPNPHPYRRDYPNPIVSIAAARDTSAILQDRGDVTLWGEFAEQFPSIDNAKMLSISQRGQEVRVLMLREGNDVAYWSASTGLQEVASDVDNVGRILQTSYASYALTEDGQLLEWSPGVHLAERPDLPPLQRLYGSFGRRLVGQDFEGKVHSWLEVTPPSDEEWINKGDWNPDLPPVASLQRIVNAGIELRQAGILAPSGPRITKHPKASRVGLGKALSLSVDVAGGDRDISYEWKHNGELLPEQTSKTLFLGSVTEADEGDYTVTVGNQYGTSTSSPASVEVISPPAWEGVPGGSNVLEGEPLSLSASASGEGSIRYQWLFRGRSLPGEIRSQLVIDALTQAQDGRYTVVASNRGGEIRHSVNVTVDRLPTVRLVRDKVQPISGQRVILRADATGTPVPAFQWYKDDQVLSGETGSTLDLGAYKPEMAGNYKVVASNSRGAAEAEIIVSGAPSGFLVSVGNNSQGQTSIPKAISGKDDFVRVAAAERHQLALDGSGEVYGWGADDFGQTSLPDITERVVDIATGPRHSLALLKDGTVIGWGFGNDDGGPADVPDDLSGVVAIAAGRRHSLALLTDGTVRAWGMPHSRAAAVPIGLEEVVAIAAGGGRSFALLADGSLLSWTSSEDITSPSSEGSISEIVPTPSSALVIPQSGKLNIPIGALSGVMPRDEVPEVSSPVIDAAVGSGHLVVVYADGTVESWSDPFKRRPTLPAGLPSAFAAGAGDGYSTVLVNSETKPFFRQHPAPSRLIVAPGESASYSVEVLLDEGVSYQWYHDGTLLEGETEATLALSEVTETEAGGYWVEASRAGETVTSEHAQLRITEAVDQRLELVGRYAPEGIIATDVDVDGDLLVVADRKGMEYVDVTDPLNAERLVRVPGRSETADHPVAAANKIGWERGSLNDWDWSVLVMQGGQFGRDLDRYKYPGEAFLTRRANGEPEQPSYWRDASRYPWRHPLEGGRPGPAWDVAVRGRNAYVASGDGLAFIDLDRSESPLVRLFEVETWQGSPRPTSVRIFGDRLYYAAADGGLYVYSLDEALPELSGFDVRLLTLEGGRSMPESGNRLLVVRREHEQLHFRIFDGKGTIVVDQSESDIVDTSKAAYLDWLKTVTLPKLWAKETLSEAEKRRVIREVKRLVAGTRLVGRYAPISAEHVAVNGRPAYVPGTGGGYLPLDAHDAKAYPDPELLEKASEAFQPPDKAYVFGRTGLSILDLQYLDSITEISRLEAFGKQPVYYNGHVYAINNAAGEFQSIKVYNVTDPEQPYLAGSVESIPQLIDGDLTMPLSARGLAVSDGLLYVATGGKGVLMFRPVEAPALAAEPSPVATEEGSDVELSVAVHGTGPLDYTWHKDGEPIEGAPNGPALSISAVGEDDAGFYELVVKNAQGSMSSGPIPVGLLSSTSGIEWTDSGFQPIHLESLPPGSDSGSQEPRILARNGAGKLRLYRPDANGKPVVQDTYDTHIVKDFAVVEQGTGNPRIFAVVRDSDQTLMLTELQVESGVFEVVDISNDQEEELMLPGLYLSFIHGKPYAELAVSGQKDYISIRSAENSGKVFVVDISAKNVSSLTYEKVIAADSLVWRDNTLYIYEDGRFSGLKDFNDGSLFDVEGFGTGPTFNELFWDGSETIIGLSTGKIHAFHISKSDRFDYKGSVDLSDGEVPVRARLDPENPGHILVFLKDGGLRTVDVSDIANLEEIQLVGDTSGDGLYDMLPEKEGRPAYYAGGPKGLGYLSAGGPPSATRISSVDISGDLVPGGTMTLTATATGVGPFHYTWKKDGEVIQAGPSNVLKREDLSFADEGDYRLRVVAASGSATWSKGAMPPETGHSIAGTRSDNGWFISRVEVTLSAFGKSGSGIAETYYRLDDGDKQRYQDPLTISDQGVHQLVYWSQDTEGGVEDEKGVDIKIDKTAPTTTLSPDGTKGENGWAGSVTITLTGTDALSGFGESYYRVDGGPKKYYFDPFLVSGSGSHTVEYWSEDRVGNVESSNSFNFDIVSKSETEAGGKVVGGKVVIWGGVPTHDVPDDLDNVVAIETGSYVGLALRSDGTVVGWGSNDWGQAAVPALLDGVSAIAAGNIHSLALKSDGTVVAWGGNFEGQATVPVDLNGVTAIDAGGHTSLALKEDGTVVGWGFDAFGQATPPSGLSDVTAIATSGRHSLALTRNGAVVAWGGNSEGQASVPAGLNDVVAIAAGDRHNLALKSDGTVVAWGSDDWGQSSVPNGLDGVRAIGASGSTSLALKSDGTVVAWGYDGAALSKLARVTAIAVGNRYNLALVNPLLKTTHSVHGRRSINGWFIDYVVVTLSALDNGDAGIAETFYTIDGGGQEKYRGYFSVVGEGDHTLTYWSEDNEGTVESKNTASIIIDQTAPETTHSLDGNRRGGGWVESVTVTLAATDAVSGIGSTFYRIDGGAKQTYTAPFSVAGFGRHQVQYWSVDRAGHIEPSKSVGLRVVSDTAVDPVAAPSTPSVELEVGAFPETSLAIDEHDTLTQDLSGGFEAEFELRSGPSSLSVNSTGELSWTPGEEEGDVSQTAVVLVERDGTQARRTIRLHANEVNEPPTSDRDEVPPAPENTLWRYDLAVTDADIPAQNLTFTLSEGPDGMSVTQEGVVRWRPPELERTRAFPVTLSVSDGIEEITLSFDVSVEEANRSPQWVMPSEPFKGTLGQDLSELLKAVDRDRPAQTLRFSLIRGPEGLRISHTGLLEWSPNPSQFAPGVYEVEAAVHDEASGTPALFTVELQADDTDSDENQRPTIEPVEDQVISSDGGAANLAVYVADAEDADKDLALDAVSSNQSLIGDADIQIDNGSSDGERLLSLTPAAGESGQTTLALSVTDSDGATAKRSFVVTVSSSATLQIQPGNVTGSAATEMVLPVAVRNFSNLSSLQFSMHWDTAVAELVGVEALDLKDLTAGHFANPTPGTLTLSWNDKAAAGVTVADETAIFQVRFRLSGRSGQSTPITIDGKPTPIEAIRGDASSVKTAATIGSIGLHDAVRITGAIEYYRENFGVPNLKVRLDGDTKETVTTDSEGAFELVAESGNSGTLRPSQVADNPANNGVSTLDILFLRRHILAPFKSTTNLGDPFAKLAADVNEDRKVTTLDILLMRRLILDPINFPFFTDSGQSLWKFVRGDFSFPDPAAPWVLESSRAFDGLKRNRSGQDFTALKLGDVNASWSSTVQEAERNQAALAGAGALRSDDGMPRGLIYVGSAFTRGAGSVEIPIRVRGRRDVSALQFSVSWDPKALRFEEVTSFGLEGMDESHISTAHVGEGKLSVAWDDARLQGVPVERDAPLLVLRFALNEGAEGATTVKIAEDPTPLQWVRGLEALEMARLPGLVVPEVETSRSQAYFSWPGGLGIYSGESTVTLWTHAPTGRQVWLERTEDLGNGEWERIESKEARSEIVRFRDAEGKQRGRQFYRIRYKGVSKEKAY